MSLAIEAKGLVKRFGEVTALDGLDLAVPEGSVLGLLGPNGAGKTTAVSILTTLLIPDSGWGTVAGVDLLETPEQVRNRIGLAGQYAAVDEHLTGFENLELIGRLYHLGRSAARRRAQQLLEVFELSFAGNRPAGTYSGGMRRRLDLAAALVAEPAVLFLDEPTTGLDPRSRQGLWEAIEDLVDQGTTLLLTTQYLEEADRLADQIVVIDHGRSIATGTSSELKLAVGGDHVEVTLASRAEVARATEIMGPFANRGEVKVAGPAISAAVSEGARALTDVLGAMGLAGIEVLDVELRRPTLDDVFLSLTGHSTDGAAGSATREEPSTRERVLS